MKKAFTLAEILIVLVIIGVLTMILLPIAFQSSPDERVMKFKKGYNTLGSVIKELVSSDEYYKDGDLGIRKNGQLIDGTHDGDVTYFCNSFSDILSTKSVDCSQEQTSTGYEDLGNLPGYEGSRYTYKESLDNSCKKYQKSEIITNDGIIFYQVNPKMTFGIDAHGARMLYHSDNEDYEDESDHKDNRQFGEFIDENGFSRIYKQFCMDIDDINKDEDPFGFGIRQDGKIITGKRADEWMNKEIQKND